MATTFNPDSNLNTWIVGNRTTDIKVYNSSSTYLGKVQLRQLLYVELDGTIPSTTGKYCVTSKLQIKRTAYSTDGNFKIEECRCKYTSDRGVTGSCGFLATTKLMSALSTDWTDLTTLSVDTMKVDRYTVANEGMYAKEVIFSYSVVFSAEPLVTNTLEFSSIFDSLTRTYIYTGVDTKTNAYGRLQEVPDTPTIADEPNSSTINLYLKYSDGTSYSSLTGQSTYTKYVTNTWWTAPGGTEYYCGETVHYYYNITLTANYTYGEKDRQNVTFTLPTPPEKTGYVYEGWYTAATGGTNVGTTYSTSTNGVNLYAHYTANTYTVSYDTKGGTAVEGTTSVTYNSAYGTLKTTSKIGYNFEGWYDLDGSVTGNWGNLITAASIFTKTTDQVLYARWSNPIPNTLSFDLAGGSWTPEEEASFSKVYTIEGTEFTIPKPHTSDPSYKFIGWRTSTANWKILDPNSTYTSDSYVSTLTINPLVGVSWNNTIPLTANYKQISKYVKRRGSICPILALYVKQSGHWIKTEDVLDPTSTTNKLRVKVNGHWRNELGS